MIEPAAAPSTLAGEVAAVHDLLGGGRYDEALSRAQPLLHAHPVNRDLLLAAAVSLRHLQRTDAALAMLARLEAVSPGFSRLHEERGLCHVARRDAPAAIASLLRAVQINPALPLSWRMLAGVYRLTGDATNAATAARHVELLDALPRAVVTATSAFSDGDLDTAEAITRAYLLQHGDHPEAMRLLARLGLARDVLDDAEVLLAAVLAIAPDHVAARIDYVQTLARRHKYREARAELGKLPVAVAVDYPSRELAATIAVGLGEQETAIALYHGLIADRPDSADLQLWLGHALKTIGRVPEAITAYRTAHGLRDDFGDAYWSLANLKTYRFSDTELAAMAAVEARPGTAPEDRFHLCFALGKASEDRNDFDRAWQYYARGNALKAATSRYRPELVETNTRLQHRVCTPAFFAARRGWGDARRDPIFIVGLPRSGSTLVEQILASHSEVEGTQELADIQRLVLELQGREPDPDNPRYPDVLAELTAGDVARMGARYLDDTAVYRRGKPVFIDKMPNNFRHIGLIHLILPNATIIDVRREPMACCFSNLKQLFANGQEFTYSVPAIARYYRTYLELMAHWDRVLPGRVLRVHYEDVVADLDGNVRRLLAHCNLAFEPGCIDFHRNPREVRTPSSEQVRQPIFHDGIDQWRNFAPHLGELRAALGDAVDRYRAA